MKKILFSLFIMLILLSFICVNSYAVGWADMADEHTTGNTNSQNNTQEEYDYTKSTNNYLKSLSVEGYKITPSFDKQNINYSIKDEIKEDTITITAEAEDDRAQVIGIGKVALKSGINVIAESGTYKTYFINVVKYGSEKEASTNVVNEENTILNTQVKETEENRDVSKKTIISMAIVILIAILVFFAVTKTAKKNNRGKRTRR